MRIGLFFNAALFHDFLYLIFMDMPVWYKILHFCSDLTVFNKPILIDFIRC